MYNFFGYLNIILDQNQQIEVFFLLHYSFVVSQIEVQTDVIQESFMISAVKSDITDEEQKRFNDYEMINLSETSSGDSSSSIDSKKRKRNLLKKFFRRLFTSRM